MFSNETAIKRFQAHEQVEVNATQFWATYTSGMFNGFYMSEDEAIAHCDNPENGCEFNGQWFQDSYSTFKPGEVFAVIGNDNVYISADKSKYLDAALGRWQIPFVEWKSVDE